MPGFACCLSVAALPHNVPYVIEEISNTDRVIYDAAFDQENQVQIVNQMDHTNSPNANSQSNIN